MEYKGYMERVGDSMTVMRSSLYMIELYSQERLLVQISPSILSLSIGYEIFRIRQYIQCYDSLNKIYIDAFTCEKSHS